ncbi:hypothetical protein BBP40_006563 [Aspergillus hancockii]|nr:hypothetical protein BBP40_006563 [Aspergillus hancockii]
MTTASSLPLPTMEPPVIDDTMEMASPYQGHADDFDIDIDVMDDQASNTDKDMMGDDEYIEPLHGTEYEQDGTNDADMIDDVAEPTMLDADDQYAETNYSVEMQYGAEKTYETEMLEDDYDEDIDAPDPEAAGSEYQGEVPNDIDEVTDGNITTETPDNSPGSVHQHNDAPDEESYDRDDEHASQEPEMGQPESGSGDKNDDGTNKSGKLDKQEMSGDHEDNSPIVERCEGHEDDAREAQLIVDERNESQVEQAKKTEVDDLHGQETEPAEQHGQGHDTTKDASLYPVKVYYQDNEISLFPPREGDSSETFFLEDESLAYAPLGELFLSCRGVLQEHVGDNEVLVVDIDALNIQLTEDSLHVAKVTLYQIVDLYLQLCHNDGVDEPEPLYLTLSTKLTISAEVSDLLLAASEGKGLSEIHVWDGYQEVEAASPDILVEGDDQGPNSNEEQEDNSNQDGQPRSEPLKTHGDDPSVDEDQVAEDQLHEQDPKGDDEGAVTSGDNSQDNDEHDEAKGSQEAGQTELENADLRDHQSPKDNPYDSEEEQHTESTATITHLPATDLTDGQQHAGGVADILHNDQEGHSSLDEQYELEDSGNEDYLEEEPEPEATDHIAYVGEAAGDASAHENEKHATAPDVEEPSEKLSEEHHEDFPSEAGNAIPQDHEDHTEETLQDDGGDASPKLDSAGSDLPESIAQPTAKPANGSLGIAEDLLKSPTQGLANLGEDIEDIEFPGELHDTVDDTASYAAKKETEELRFDDEEEYLDLEITEDLNVADEETGAKSPGLASTKRHREPEDEFELAESPTPDTKRSRPS